MADQLSSSEARKGEVVTTICRFGGVGIGYLVDGQVWKTTGSYWACKAEDDVTGMVEYHRDGGEGYKAKARKITGWNI